MEAALQIVVEAPAVVDSGRSHGHAVFHARLTAVRLRVVDAVLGELGEVPSDGNVVGLGRGRGAVAGGEEAGKGQSKPDKLHDDSYEMIGIDRVFGRLYNEIRVSLFGARGQKMKQRKGWSPRIYDQHHFQDFCSNILQVVLLPLQHSTAGCQLTLSSYCPVADASSILF